MGIILIGALAEAVNFPHHRTGLKTVEIQGQLLSPNLFDRALRGQGATSSAKKAGERGPNLPLELQGDELEQASGDTAQHHEALARLPGLVHVGQRLEPEPFEVGIFLDGVAFDFGPFGQVQQGGISDLIPEGTDPEMWPQREYDPTV